jgi:hypothetical protein
LRMFFLADAILGTSFSRAKSGGAERESYTALESDVKAPQHFDTWRAFR